MIKLESAHIEEVRGIRKLDLDCRREKFAISGPNGSGKSGVIDAIEFGLTGHIGRLTGRGTKGLSVSEHGPHVDKTKFPDAAFVTLRVFLTGIGKSATITRKVTSPKTPKIEPADADVKAALAEIADHPEITLSRREILRFILVEPTKRSEEIQTILKLDEIGQTRSLFNAAQNKLQGAQKIAAAKVQSDRNALQLHLQIATLLSEDLLAAVNKRRKVLDLPEITTLTADTKLDAGLSDTLKPTDFNKESALRDLKALTEAAKGFPDLAKTEAAAIVADLASLEADPALLAALQRRAFIEKGLDLVDGPECPLCDTPWNDEQHLRDHLKAKLAKSEKARKLQDRLQKNGMAIAAAAIRVTGLLTPVQKLAEGQGASAFALLLTTWKTDLEALKTKLATVEGLTGLKNRLTGGWLEMPKVLPNSLKGFTEQLDAKPDQSATLDAQTFLTTAQVRLGDYREALRKNKAAEIAWNAAKAAYDIYCNVLEEELNTLYDEVQKDFSTFYRAINGEDESTFTAKLTPSEGSLGLDVNFYERGLFPPAAYHSEGHQDGMGVCLYLALMKRLFEVVAESGLFEFRMSVAVAEGDDQETIRIQLKVAGLTDSLVVTGRRIETRLSETPQQIQLVTREDIERSVAVDLTDVLKKNSGVDVIQYPGLLSGVGMRGFNPEFSGINKRSLLLIDGRPSGVTNLASLLLDNVDHVEVLKGPASSVYGASAMGGVINVITKRSRGPIAGNLRLGLQSFATSDIAGKVGGSLSSRVDFDASFNVFNQRDDYRVGSGIDKRAGYELGSRAVYPYSSYRNTDGWARVGADLSRTWRIDGRVNVYRARDVLNPGDVFAEGTRTSRKNFDRSTSDLRVQGQLGRHALSTTAYTAGEQSRTTSIKSTNPAEQPFLPFLSFEGFLDWKGLQVQDAWAWRKGNSLIVGLDSELVTSESRRYLGTGERFGPFAADSTKRTVGAYAENTLKINSGFTVISLGGRVDSIRIEALDTPFKTGFTPSATTFSVFNPSVGVKQLLVSGVRAHATAGRAFVPADAGALTGYNEGIVGGRTQIIQGNPNLKPERSVSFDVGVERASTSNRLDVTYFQTKVSDRVVSNIVISNPPPPGPVILSYVNALGARMRGVEADYDQRLNGHVGVSASLTHYFTHREQIPTTGERHTNVVANNSVRAAVDLDFGPVTGRVSARYVQGRRDLDFNTAGTPQIDYEDFAVVDLSAVYRLTRQHSVSLVVNNLLDRYFYEKLGFPHSGRTFGVKYQLGLGSRP